MQTRFAKLDHKIEPKFDAIILAVAGLKRMKYEKRITQYLEPEICMYAVGQGALAIQGRKNDIQLIKMINELSDEKTVLKCVAERAFMAKLEAGCSSPVGVNSKVDETWISLEGVILNKEATKKIKDKCEIRFNYD